MVEAYVLLKVEPGEERNVYNKLKELPEVKDINELYGEWDIIIKIETPKFDDLDSIITDKIRTINSIKNTTTMIVAKYKH